MTGGRSKRRKWTCSAADATNGGSGISDTLPSASCDGLLMASLPPGVDFYEQARKALTERCPFDSAETSLRFGTLPSAMAAYLHKKSDGRRKHCKVQEDAVGMAAGPGRPPASLSVWEKTEAYFRPLNLDDIDLLVTRLPPDSYFYIPYRQNVLEEDVKDEAVPNERPPGEMDVVPSTVVVKEELENIQIEAAQAVLIGSNVTYSTALPLEKSETEDNILLNWILGCKQRFLLTSSRHSAKRKLFVEEASLEQLLLLPRIETAGAVPPLCDFCCLEESDMKFNRLLLCDSCKVSVHQKCYGVHEVPSGGWLCSWCNYLVTVGNKTQRAADNEDPCFRPCLLCPKAGGALKPLDGNLKGGEVTKFVHLFCCLWSPGMYVEDISVMEPVINVEGLLETQRRLVCSLCKVKHGTCVRCSHGTCRISFHPICARAAKHQIEIWGKFGLAYVELRVFCSKHSHVKNLDIITSGEQCSTTGHDDVVGKLLPGRGSIKRFPKIKITHKRKDANMVQDRVFSTITNERVKVDSNLDKQNNIRSEGEVAQSNEIDADCGNALQNTSNVISIFRKIIDSRNMSIADVASELNVPSASLESSVMEVGSSIPSELKLKIVKWLQKFVCGQPSTCQLKSKNGCLISSDVTDHRFVKSQQSCSRKINEHDSIDDITLPSFREAFLEDNSSQKSDAVVGDEPSDRLNDMVKDAKDYHIKDLDVATTTLGNAAGLAGSNASREQLVNDKDKLDGDLKEVSHCSRLVENNQNFEADITELKTDSLELPDHNASLTGNLNNQDAGLCFRSSFSDPFIMKKLRVLQRQWHLLHKPRNIKPKYNDKLSIFDTNTVGDCHPNVAKLDQLMKVKNLQTMDIIPADEVEGELLQLQNCLLDRVTSIKRLNELIYKIISHLPQELDAFRRKGWDMVLVNQYLREVKEAKKRGRRERRHKEAQAILAAAAAASAASRNSMIRKDDGVSSTQQNRNKISSANRRTTVHSQAPLPKETGSRPSVNKVSSDKHFGEFKFLDFAQENVLLCDVCWRTETIVNRIFVCSSCKVSVHLDCYRKLKDPMGPWLCELCEDASLKSSPRNQPLGSGEKTFTKAHCILCSGVTGAFRKSTDGEWVHAFCAEWLLESTYKRGQQNLVGGMDAIFQEKDLNTCSICHYRIGLCLKCSYGHCQAKFHATCARSSGLFMNIKAIGGRFQHKAYCEKHSVEQREKVDSLHGAEELKNIKQVRVDLEKVRLLCERIIKREKVKRDLAVCSHGILASRRDCIAFSAMVRSSFTPGISSESATTSIDNPSISATFQRRDDMTIDSAIYGRQFGRHLIDVDRTDDSSTSQLSNRRNLADRTVFSGKQLPQRPTNARVSSTADCEIRSKDKKGIKSLPKEKVMTSYQASLQNSRLPKGFVYIPVGSLQKDGSAAQDSTSCELPEPGG